MKNSFQKGSSRVVLITTIIVVVIVLLVIIAFVSGAAKVDVNVSTDNDQQPAESTAENAQMAEEEVSITSYENSTYGISLDHPTTWTVQEGATSDPAFGLLSQRESADDIFTENIGVTVTDLSTAAPGLSSSEAVDIWLNENQNNTGFAVVDREATTIDGNAAEQAVYTATLQGVAIQGRVTIVMKNDIAYIMLYTAEQDSFEKFLSDVDAIFASVKIS